MNSSTRRDPIRVGSELVTVANEWLVPSAVLRPVVVLVHGFTSHGYYLSDLATYLNGNGYLATLFNYDSYKGIDVAAGDLENRVQPVNEPLAKYGYVVVGHSLGGLVVRQFARIVSGTLRSSLKGIVLLGAPNNGTLAGRQFIRHMVAWADWLTGPHPYARSTLSRTALQLTLNDPERFVELLNWKDRSQPPAIPVLSISGGLTYLEFSNHPHSHPVNWVRNQLLQRLLRERPNDGLVPESSSSAHRSLRPLPGRFRQINHQGTYRDFERTNHTNLVHNQEIAAIVVQWLRDVGFAP